MSRWNREIYQMKEQNGESAMRMLTSFGQERGDARPPVILFPEPAPAGRAGTGPTPLKSLPRLFPGGQTAGNGPERIRPKQATIVRFGYRKNRPYLPIVPNRKTDAAEF